jgi:hypothetical protein
LFEELFFESIRTKVFVGLSTGVFLLILAQQKKGTKKQKQKQKKNWLI